jgi:flagella basal body P-ring formation protein FlgA
MRWLISIIAVFAVIVAADLSHAAQMIIQLRETATVRSTQVLLRDVAKVTCQDSSQQAKLESQEIRLLDLTQGTASITKMSVRTRLALAGWNLSHVRLTGPSTVLVSFHEPQVVTDADVEAAARETLCLTMGVDDKDLTVRLQSAFISSIPTTIREQDGLRIEITPPTRKSLGMVTMQVHLWNDKDLVLSRSASFEVRKRHRVAVAKVSLSREVPLDGRSVQFENRFLAAEMDELDPSQVEGRNVRASVVAGSVLQLRDLQATSAGLKPVVKRGDLVQVIVFAGRLRTSMRDAEALQDGGVGELIELKNRDSGLKISGRVIGPGQVLIRVR